MISNLLYKVYWRLTDNRWQIAFPQTSLEKMIAGEPYKMAILKNAPKDTWFADPFVLDVTPSTIVLLVEEFLLSCGRGRIARLTISRPDYTLLKNETLIDLDTHLSFPAIKREAGRIFIYPENSASRKLTIYEYDIATGQCRPYNTMCDKGLIDAIQEEVDGKDYVFATTQPSPNGHTLGVYEAKNGGGYFLCQSITFNENIARNGGAFFHVDGKTYRPAQDCNHGYGRGLSIQEMKYADGRFAFVEKIRLKSPRGHLDFGMHTLNEYKGVIVTDITTYRRPIIGHFTDVVWQKLHWPISLK